MYNFHNEEPDLGKAVQQWFDEVIKIFYEKL